MAFSGLRNRYLVRIPFSLFLDALVDVEKGRNNNKRKRRRRKKRALSNGVQTVIFVVLNNT